ncbi:MAG TPA: ATP-binding protein [Solirubrobacterales bacterium]
MVEAIAAAPAHEPETEALEWKSELPLEDGAGARFSAARQIIGFANRDPDRAAQHFEGCGYLVIGLAPGQIAGTSPLDPADIDNWLSEYLGQDGPQWRADYIDVEGVAVLVFTIEPPRWGDPIQTLRKGYEGATAGRVFIRRAGKTVEAGPAEIRMLEARSKRGSDRVAVDLTCEVEEGSLQPFLAEKDAYFAWRDNERERLESALPRYLSAARNEDFVARPAREIRTPETYNEEVRRYLGRAQLRWQALVWEGVIELRLAVIKPAIRNLSDRNFRGVEITLTVPEAIKPFIRGGEAAKRLGAPAVPAPYGSRTAVGQIARFREVEPVQFFGPSVELSNDGNRVVFDPEDVRPHQLHRLPEVFLAVPRPLVDESVEVEWRATSTSADGDVGGVVELQVGENPVEAPFLVAAAEDAAG